MKRKDIVHFSTFGDTKASVVERFNRTLKERMYRYFTVKNTLKYLPVLKDLVMGYNRSYHRSIKMAPIKVSVKQRGASVEEFVCPTTESENGVKPILKVGDRVRLNKKYRIFKKGYLPGWTEEVFVVGKAMVGERRAHLQDQRMGRDAGGGDVLQRGFAESHREGRRSVSSRKDRQAQRG